MVKEFVFGSVLAATVSVGALASAEQAQPGRRMSAGEREQVTARYNIFVMEGVLERAVDHGADTLRRRVHSVMPDMLLISGGAEARGFRLDGYGVFFDVEVPVMRRSVAWTLRMMVDESGVGANTALQQVKSYIELKTPDPREKANLLQAIKRLELLVAPPHIPQLQAAPGGAEPPVVTPGAGPATPASQRGTVSAMNAMPPTSETPVMPQIAPVDQALLEDPSGQYEKEVIGALIDAMLDHSGPIGVGADEWLTVAARDNEQRDRLTPGDPYDLLTIVLRIKGSDLAAFRADRITREEARKRVEVREF